MRLSSGDPVAAALVPVIHAGDVESLRRLLDGHDGLAAARINDDKGTSRTALHVAAYWPGYFPDDPSVVRLLIEADADPDAPVAGSWHSETPLRWAASSDDVDVADALTDGGADMEAQAAPIGGRTPLDDAVAYRCWHVARRLAERGARVDRLWHAAAPGTPARVEELLAADPAPSPDAVNDAFWQACHGGQRRVAEYLLTRGADLNGTPDHSTATPLDIAGSPGTRREALVSWLRERGARSAGKPA